MARIAIVDDHALARQGLRDMLADEPDIEVVGEASNGREALDLCRRLRPDLILMDVRMPEMDGLAATRKVKQEYPGTSVLMMTMHENLDYLYEAIKAGAAGYVLKDATQHDVFSAVRRVLCGESPLDTELAARLLRKITSEGGPPGSPPEPSRKGWQRTYMLPLTARELEVLQLMKLGQTNPQISKNLWISMGTVKNHVEHIIAKLGVSDRTQAVVCAMESGLLDSNG